MVRFRVISHIVLTLSSGVRETLFPMHIYVLSYPFHL
jgi:hypothetical protein